MANPKARTETKIAIAISIKRLNALERNCSHEVACMCVHVCVHVCVCMCAIKYASKFKWKAARLKCRRGRKAELELLLPCCINWDSAVVWLIWQVLPCSRFTRLTLTVILIVHVQVCACLLCVCVPRCHPLALVTRIGQGAKLPQQKPAAT